MNDHRPHDSLEEAYALLGASSSSELARKFIEEDQKLLKTQTWDYKNPELLINKVKEIVECSFINGLVTDDMDSEDDCKTILWFWYHHATGYALWGYKEKDRALEFSAKALKYQTDDNPNQVTRLLYLLIRDEEEAATEWVKAIVNESEKIAARDIMEQYHAGKFF